MVSVFSMRKKYHLVKPSIGGFGADMRRRLRTFKSQTKFQTMQMARDLEVENRVLNGGEDAGLRVDNPIRYTRDYLLAQNLRMPLELVWAKPKLFRVRKGSKARAEPIHLRPHHTRKAP